MVVEAGSAGFQLKACRMFICNLLQGLGVEQMLPSHVCVTGPSLSSTYSDYLEF